MNSLTEKIKFIQSRIDTACLKSGRKSKDVKILAVSKMQPDELIEEAYENGLRDFGENYVQELVRKYDLFKDKLPGIRWHLIGPLQTNKVKAALPAITSFHALDSHKLLEEISKRHDPVSEPLPVFLQVNIDREKKKSGVFSEEVPQFVDEILNCKAVTLKGLMAIPLAHKNLDEMRPAFREMQDLRNYLNQCCGRIFELSMGMSDDFEIAIEEGANWIRLGRSLFGERNQ